MAHTRAFSASTAVPVSVSQEKSGKIGGPRFVKAIKITARTMFTIILYVIWPLFKRWLSPDFVFQVYGTDQDKRMYFPRWAEKYMRGVFPLGIIRYGGIWGFIGATVITAEDMEKDPQQSLRLQKAARVEFPNAKRFALAGRLPGFISHAGGATNSPFVDGRRGTRFAMLTAAINLAAKAGIDPNRARIVVPGGAGYTGTKVVEDLAKNFGQVVAIDPRYTERMMRGNILFTPVQSDVVNGDLALVLTASGDDIIDIVPYFTRGTHLADDTHPPIHHHIRVALRARGVIVWKATVSDGRLSMFPRLPNFRRDDIPGCLLETLVVLLRGESVLDNQEAFNQAAIELGFSSRLDSHQNDS